MLERLLDVRLPLAFAFTLAAAACGGNPVKPVVEKAVNNSSTTGTVVTLKVEGLVTRLDGTCPALTFIVNSTDAPIVLVGTRVSTTAQTVYEASSCTALRNNMKVQIEGLWQPDGSVVAVKVKYDPK